MLRSPTEISRVGDLRFFRLVMVALALLTVAAGFLIGLSPSWLGLEADDARNIASVFVAAGVGDTLVLYFWDRIFDRA
jgi:hypothetical protein